MCVNLSIINAAIHTHYAEVCLIEEHNIYIDFTAKLSPALKLHSKIADKVLCKNIS